VVADEDCCGVVVLVRMLVVTLLEDVGGLGDGEVVVVGTNWFTS
jgi:hypothetical protein